MNANWLVIGSERPLPAMPGTSSSVSPSLGAELGQLCGWAYAGEARKAQSLRGPRQGKLR